MNLQEFPSIFKSLTGNDPFPWQGALFQEFVEGRIPACCDLPTGLGKTSVVALWLIALAAHPERVPRRLAYVVNRRTVVDQTTVEVENLRKNLVAAGLEERLKKLCATENDIPLAISTLRGQFADNREWSADPCRPAVIVGTVDMIGSRLLFSGYGAGFKTRPLFAGFLGQDVLLVHDEAHLEPAFQRLLDAIKEEQKESRDERKIKVMQLSATILQQEESPFTLTEEEKNPPAVIPDSPTKPIEVVWQRMKAKKGIAFEKAEDVATRMGQLAKARAKSHPGTAILIYVNTLEDHAKICTALKGGEVQILTGTMRGLERDRMINPREETGCPIFARFLKPPSPDDMDSAWKVTPKAGTVYLVCTSAGEVGIDLSADHMICDLTTFERMAQRLGRVNRFGKGDAEIDIVYEAIPNSKKKDEPYEQARWHTLELLNELPLLDHRRSASPLALMEFRQRDDLKSKIESAYTPWPTLLPATDILFDSWSLTSITDKLPGRPPVEPYLHGIVENEPPQTRVAWREEVGVLKAELRKTYDPAELLKEYPLKPHELLSDLSDRIFKHLAELAKRHPDAPVWLVDDIGEVNQDDLTLGKLAIKEEKERMEHRTVLLSPSVGGLQGGLLDGGSGQADDVADEWLDEKKRHRRLRVWDDDPEAQSKTQGMRLIMEIDTRSVIDEDEDSEDAVTPCSFWRWYERPDEADNDGSASAMRPVTLEVHTRDIEDHARCFAEKLGLPSELAKALVLAARFHDLGKKREIWQYSIRNFQKPALAKSNKPMDWQMLDGYRHEFGSLLDIAMEAEFGKLSEEMKDVVLHLVAAHHGRARPHFPAAESRDRERSGVDAKNMALEVPRRFARLQQRYGRWGLAWLESLLRAADYAASAAPSENEKETP